MQTEIQTQASPSTEDRYARCLENSRRIRWDIDKDVIRGRTFDFSGHFLPDGLSMVNRLTFLSAADARLLSQIQGRTYANIFGLVERFINAKVLELSREHWLGDQVALEALVSFSQEEMKHQELFRRIERMIAAGMPAGYTLGRPARTTSPRWSSASRPGRCWPSPATSSSSPRCTTSSRSSPTARCPRSSRTSSSSTGRRSRSTPSSTSWSGRAATPGSRRPSGIARWMTSSPWSGRWTD